MRILFAVAAGIMLSCGAVEKMVIYPEKALPVEKFAAEELALYLGKSTGEKFAATPENKADMENVRFVVGQCRARIDSSPLKDGEFVISAVNGRVYIRGGDGPGKPLNIRTKAGTLFGVYDYLENECGITWLWPGEDGEDVPRREWKTPADFTRKDAPRWRIRQMIMGYMRFEPKDISEQLSLWCRRQKLGWSEPAWFGHSWHYYIFKSGMDKIHPEWLALYGGERRGPHCCTSNPEFRKYIAGQVFDSPQNKNMAIASISPSDGYGFCECENCRKLDKPGTDYASSLPDLSDRHWDYANAIAREVKKRDPSRGVGMFAYTSYRNPPGSIDKFEDNLYLSMTFSKGYFVKPEAKKEFFERLDNWKSKQVKIVGREYWGMHYWLSLPYLFTRQIAEAMPRLCDDGMIGMYGEAQKDFATQGPNYYLVAKLLWNPYDDSKAILERYYRAFGPAAPAIRRYFDTFEQAILDHNQAIEDFSYRKLIYSWPEVLDNATLDKAGAAIAEARKAAIEPRHRNRVEFIVAGYDYTRIMTELLTLYRRLGQAGVPLTAFSLEGDRIEAAKYKLPSLPADVVELWEKRPAKPLAQDEKIALLKRAVELGEARARILKDNANNAAISFGMYQYTLENGIRPWHQTCVDELAKLTLAGNSNDIRQ